MIPRKKLDIRWSDLLYGTVSCFVKKHDPLKIRKEIDEKWGHNNYSLLCLSVRSGFDALLNSVNFPKGSEVLCSAVTIGDMVKITQANGLVAVPIDMNMDRLSVDESQIESSITKNTRAILVAHLFGSIMPMERIVAVARKYNLMIIEDCAQAFAGFDYSGHPESDVVMFSFGPIKTSTALGGAVLLFRDECLRNTVESLQNGYRRQSNGEYFRRLVKYAFLKMIINSGCFKMLYHICRMWGKNHDVIIGSTVRGFSGSDFFDRIRRFPCSALCKLLKRKLHHFRPSVIRKRTENAAAFISLIPGIRRPGNNAYRHTHWVFPVESEQPDRLIRYLWEKGVDATRGASNLSAITVPERSPYREPANAAARIQNVVYLPVYEGVTKKDIQKVAGIIMRFEETN